MSKDPFEDRLARVDNELATLEAEAELKPTSVRNLQTARNQLVFAQAAESAGRREMAQGYLTMAESIYKSVVLSEIADDATRGAAIRGAAKKGHRVVHGSDEEKDSRRIRTREVLAQVRTENQALSLTQAKKATARRLGISYSTVRRHTE